VACSEGELDELTRRLPPDTLSARVDGLGCIVLSDPDGPGRRGQFERALRTGAQGPTTPLSGLAGSWSLARAAWRAIEAGVLGREGLVRVDEALPALLLFENRELIERIAARRLAPFEELSPKARRRMEETTLAFVQHQGNAAAMARALGLHAQTARYRLGRLRELLGDELDDPDARFELELSLRAQMPDGASPS
jgi:sugar diacid utilization regulator